MAVKEDAIMILKGVRFLNDEFEFDKGDIIIKKGYIKEIVPQNNIETKVIVLPAFISTHSHFGETIFRGLVDNLNIEEYIKATSKINKDNEEFKNEIRKTCCEFTIIELVKQGISTVQSARSWEYVRKSPLKADLGYPLMKSKKLINYYENFQHDFKKIFKKFNKDKIKVGLWIHSFPYVDEGVLEQVFKLFKTKKLLLTLHLDESKRTVAQTIKKYGESGVKVLKRHGLLNERTNLVHCVHTTKQDLDIIRENNANITLCPTTNLKLIGHLPNFDYIHSNINYSLANDGLAANNSANFYELMKITALLFSKLKLDPKELLASVTKNPALTLNRLDQGIIKEGFKADLQIIKCDDSSLYPMSNILSNLIYSRTRGPSSLILDGELVMKNGKILFSSELNKCKKIQEIFNKLLI